MKNFNYLFTIIFLSASMIYAQKSNESSLMVSDLQRNLIESRFETSNDHNSPDLFSDILQITKSGGLERVNPTSIGGIILNDSTVHYVGDNYDITVTYLVDYVLNSETVEEWSVFVDSAKVNYSMSGFTRNKFMKFEKSTSTVSFLVSGLRPASQNLTVDMHVVSPMRVLTMKLKLWLIWDLYFEETLNFNQLVVSKLDNDVLSGTGLINIDINWRGEHFPRIEAEILFVGVHSVIIYIGDESFSIYDFYLRDILL